MEILLDDNEKITFTWRQSGGLTIQRWAPGTATEKPWVLVGTSVIEGEALIHFLEGLSLPILRRALAHAVKWPDWKGGKL